MLVAIRSFSVRGHPPFKAGVSRVAEDHAVAIANPQHFKPAPGRPGSRERISSMIGTASIVKPRAASANLGRESWRLSADVADCIRFDRPSTTAVRLAADARRDLVRLLDTSRVDNRESGALLIGIARRDLIEVVEVAPAGRDSRRELSRFAFDASHFARVATDAKARELTVVGTAHSHLSGHRALSTRDLATLAGVRAAGGLTANIALIATFADQTRLDAWIISAGFGADHCRPAAAMV